MEDLALFLMLHLLNTRSSHHPEAWKMAFLDTADSKHAAPSDAVSSTAGGKSHEKKTGSSDSPIFRLPAEIRNMIWQYVVDGRKSPITSLTRSLNS